MINRLRIFIKSFLPGLPGVGSFFQAWFERRESRYLRRQAIAEKQRLRRIAHEWRHRIRTVLECPDNKDIPCIPGAGCRDGNEVIMHNGLRIAYGTYGTYDAEYVMQMLTANRGIHEPQEEKIFQQVLPLMPPGAVMLELGAFWGFYSLWFSREVSHARCFLVEPVLANLNAGRLNFLLNNLQGTFVNAMVGKTPRRQPYQPPTISVDRFMEEHQLEKIDLLHSDIQGFEYEMLLGATKAFKAGKIDFVFISTHSNSLHEQCREWLQQIGFRVVADANLDETYSADGLLVAHRSDISIPSLNPISKKPRL